MNSYKIKNKTIAFFISILTKDRKAKKKKKIQLNDNFKHTKSIRTI